jgi:uncharacterized small protein (DUF1192 family)
MFPVDLAKLAVKIPPMDLDELFAKRPDDPLIALARQDLDPFSVAELKERAEILEAELARVNQKIEGSVNFRSTADALFKKAT